MGGQPVSDELPVSVCLVSIDPAKNRYRRYRITWQPTLWGEGALVRSWGRRGSIGRSQRTVYPDQASAQQAFQRLLRLRLRHGYHVLQ
jgi:predicted DNA-binding WGR domain protein